MIFISRFFGAYEPRHPKKYMKLCHTSGGCRCQCLAPGLAMPQAASFSQVGISGGHLICGKAKPLSFNVQIFLKSTVFQQRIQHAHWNGNQGLREVLSLRHDQRCFAAILPSQTSQSGPCCAGGFIMLLCSFQWPRQIAAFSTLSPTRT